MLYLVSGSSRSGKTTIARDILQQHGIPYLSLDWLVMGFTNGMPQCAIHDKLFPHEIAEKMRHFLVAMCKSMLWTGESYVIEGEAMLPETTRQLIDENPEKIKACFLGYTTIEVQEKVRQLKAFSNGEPDWLLSESEQYIEDHIRNMLDHSKTIERHCAEQGIQYFDTSSDFLGTISRATDYLLT